MKQCWAVSDLAMLGLMLSQGDSLQPPQLDATHWKPVPEPEVWKRARDVMQVRACGDSSAVPIPVPSRMSFPGGEFL
jgi:hypothetical protein